tara:strand:+ start:256 stop:453 length:198 start_codon:yes stop_codon:yes gene_type:complete
MARLMQNRNMPVEMTREGSKTMGWMSVVAPGSRLIASPKAPKKSIISARRAYISHLDDLIYIEGP